MGIFQSFQHKSWPSSAYDVVVKNLSLMNTSPFKVCQVPDVMMCLLMKATRDD